MLQQWLEQDYFYWEGINSCCSDTLLSINGWLLLAEADVAWYCSSSSHRWHAIFGQWSTKCLVFQILWCDYGCLSYRYNEGCNPSSFQLTEITIPVMIRYRLFVTNWHPTYVQPLLCLPDHNSSRASWFISYVCQSYPELESNARMLLYNLVYTRSWGINW